MTTKLDQIVGGTYEIVDLRVLVPVTSWNELLVEVYILREALLFYAGWKSWMPRHATENRLLPSRAAQDAGEIARKALGEGK